jgi:SAM-dependent methyltransferase
MAFDKVKGLLSPASLRAALARMRGDTPWSLQAIPPSTLHREERFAREDPDQLRPADGDAQRALAFKADVLNALVAEQAITRVIEFGCGDGRQLERTPYPAYIGLDAARHAVLACKRRFAGDRTKSFFLCDPLAWVDNHAVFQGELAISLDVLCYLVEDEVFDAYMACLFDAASRFVAVHSTNQDAPVKAQHIRHRRFTVWVARHRPEWALIRTVASRPPSEKETPTSVPAEFFIFERKPAPAGRDTPPPT